MPTTVQFYHLRATPPERALPKLVEKAYSAGYRVHLVLDSEERAQLINELLWTYDPGAFLPHGAAKDGNAERQPIYLSTSLDAPNHPTLLFVTEGSQAPEPASYARILDMFDGRDETAVAGARARWKAYKDAGCEVAYFRQAESGGWEKAGA